MCGINFIWDKRNRLDQAPIERMNQAMSHRGPDATNFTKSSFGAGTVWLGHTRLKIIDLSNHANQPYVRENKQLIYNGELYNHLSLRDQNLIFQTNSDTETLHRHLSLGQPLDHFNGMFAFVFFDGESIRIARDRFGVKPLFYFENDDYLIFSSEIKGIFASGLVHKSINKKMVQHYLKYKMSDGKNTFFEGIQEFPKNTLRTIKEQGETEDREIFAPEVVNKDHDLKNLPSIIKTGLSQAVKDQMLADVPVGLFLSGGVDSTLILALLQESGRSGIPTFSVGNGQAGSFGTEDYLFAQKAAKQYVSEHTHLEIDHSILNRIDEIIEPFDQPIGDSASLLMRLLSEEAQKQVKTVLTGAGADELFAGYNRLKAFHFLQSNKRLPYTLLKHLPTGFEHPLRKQFRLLKKLGESVKEDDFSTFKSFTSLGWEVDESPIESRELNLAEAEKYDIDYYLKNDVLALTDRFSMSRSLEARVPFLDQSVVSLALSVPTSNKLVNGQKWILKSILDDLGGAAYTQRRKEGLGLPTGHWLRMHEYAHLLEFRNQKGHHVFEYIDFNHVNEVIDAHLKRKADYSQELWAIVVLVKWLEAQNSL